MGSKAVFGTMAGYMMGRFVKQLTDIAIFYAGLGIILVGGLHYMHWVTINWKQIDEDLLHLWVRARTSAQDSGFVARIKRMLIRTAPLMIGFVSGFKIAFLAHAD